MKNIIKFILFLIYTIGIFLIQNPIVILWGIGINLICIVIQNIKLKRVLENLWSFIGFILFTGFINVIVVDIYYGAIIAIKLMIVCNITFVYANSIHYLQFAETIVKIMTPLKLLKIDVENIGIIICIALTFIPILRQELDNMKLALKAKGSKTSAFHLILQSKYVLLPMLTSVLNRINEIEYSLKAKAYVGE